VNAFRLISLTLTLFLAGSLFGPPAPGHAQQAETKKEEPKRLEITSDKMRTEDNGRKIIFSGNVRGTWEDVILTSEILEVYTKPAEKDKKGKPTATKGDDPGRGQELEKIIAIKNVDVVKGTKRTRGDKAVYYDKDQKMVLTGTPHATAWEKENILEGPEMIFYMNEDRFEVTNGVKLILLPKNTELEQAKNKKKN